MLNVNQYPAFGLLAGILFLVGVVVYYSSNTVLPMYGLSREYFLAGEAEKPLIEAAGRALLARGADLGLGTFLRFPPFPVRRIVDRIHPSQNKIPW